MSHPARAPRSGIDGQANAAGGREWRIEFDQSGRGGVGRIRPGRSRMPAKDEIGEKTRKLPPDSRQKESPPRKAPSRGRYIDEYARPF